MEKVFLHPERVTATEDFLIPMGLVVRINNEAEFDSVLAKCEERGINKDSIKRARLLGFDNYHMDAGFRVIAQGEMCLEYQIGKGFASVSYKDAKGQYDHVISAEDYINNIYL